MFYWNLSNLQTVFRFLATIFLYKIFNGLNERESNIGNISRKPFVLHFGYVDALIA